MMELKNEINNNIETDKNNVLSSIMGNTINNAIDIGLKSILPDLIENQVIEIKDVLIKNGLKEGIETAVETAIDFGKSTIGIFTGNFENMTQVKIAVADGGIVDTISEVLDMVIEKACQNGYINKSISMAIKNGKDVLLENVSNNINNKLDEQVNAIEKIDRYVKNWNEYYNNKDFEGMCKEYNKIKARIDEVVPIEKTIKEIRNVEILHNLIKNNGKNFEITDLEKKLVENLAAQ